jgi:predicted membrane GTPase involved in stress response
MTWEFALEFIKDDELVAGTPKSIRPHKCYLIDDEHRTVRNSAMCA